MSQLQILIACLIVLPFLNVLVKTDDNTAEKFFNETYLEKYKEAENSNIKSKKIEFAEKIASEVSLLSNEEIIEFCLLKAVKLVNDFVDGYPVAIKIYDGLFKQIPTAKNIKNLNKLDEIFENFIKSLPSTKKDEKNEAYEKHLAILLHLSDQYYQKELYQDATNKLKNGLYVAKNLQYPKTIDRIEIYLKELIPFLAKERSVQSSREKIEKGIDLEPSLNTISEILFSDFGNIKKAIPFMLRLNPKDKKYQIASLIRKYHAKDQRASQAPLYFKEKDLDKPDLELIMLLLADTKSKTQAQTILNNFLNNDKKAILEALDLGETLVDSGSLTEFKEYSELITLLSEVITKFESKLAKSKCLDFTIELLNEQKYMKEFADDLNQAKIKIKLKELEDQRIAVEDQLINILSIPTSIKEPDFSELADKRIIKNYLALENIKAYGNLDLTDFRKVNTYAKIFLLSEQMNEKDLALFNKEKWIKKTLLPNSQHTAVEAETDKLTLFHCYIHCEKTQKIKLQFRTFGKPTLFINNKPVRIIKTDDETYCQTIIKSGENLIRLVLHHTNKEQTREFFSITIRDPDGNNVENIKTSTRSYRQ